MGGNDVDSGAAAAEEEVAEENAKSTAAKLRFQNV